MTRLPELVLLSTVYAVAARLLFRPFNMDALIAHILELRLFIDEPALVFRAQRGLIAENLRLLRHFAIPCAILAVPFALTWSTLDRHFGYGPLRPGEPVVVTSPHDWNLPSGILAETPPVRILRTGEVSRRVAPVTSAYGPFPAEVQVPYPPQTILHLHWTVWFLAQSSLFFAILKPLRLR